MQTSLYAKKTSGPSLIQHFTTLSSSGSEVMIRSSDCTWQLRLQCVVLQRSTDTGDEHRAFPMGPCSCWCHRASVLETAQMASHNSCIRGHCRSWIVKAESETYLPQVTNPSSDLQWNKYMTYCQDAVWKSSPGSYLCITTIQEVNKRKLCEAGEKQDTSSPTNWTDATESDVWQTGCNSTSDLTKLKKTKLKLSILSLHYCVLHINALFLSKCQMSEITYRAFLFWPAFNSRDWCVIMIGFSILDNYSAPRQTRPWKHDRCRDS